MKMKINEMDLEIEKVKGKCIAKEDFMKMLDSMKFQFIENAYLNLITGIIIDANNGNVEIIRKEIHFN